MGKYLLFKKKDLPQQWRKMKKWSDFAKEIDELWEEGYKITDMDYCGGYYTGVFTKNTGWGSQSYIYSKSWSSSSADSASSKISLKWKEDYQVTSVMYDGIDFVAVLTKNTGITTQTWFTRKEIDGMKDSISENWKEGYDITSVACGKGVNLCIMSKGLNWKQNWRYYSEIPIDELMDLKHNEGSIVTEIFDLSGMSFVVTSSNTGYSKQRIHKNSDYDRVAKLRTNRWNEGYDLTTVSHVKGEWIFIFSK